MNSSGSYLAKYDASGNLIWVKRPTGNGYCWATRISTDANGNSYITGGFDSTLVFGNYTLSNIGIEDGFVVKYDASGNVVWAKSFNGSGAEVGYGICTDAIGHVYVTGFFTDTSILFGSDTLTNIMGSSNVFVAVMDTSSYSNVGIETINSLNKITIYPNPSNRTFYFSGVQSGYTIELYNVIGEMVYTAQATYDNYPVSIAGHTKGMYFYKVSNNSVPIQQGKMVLE